MSITKVTSIENIIVDDNLCLHVPSICFASELYQVIDENRTLLNQYLPWPRGVTHQKDSEDFLRSSLAAHKNDETKTYVILFGGKLVGIISFNKIDKQHHSAEIGYWLSLAYHGNGIITRAVNALTQHYAANSMIKNFVIKCSVDNLKSNQVAMRCGFLYQETLIAAERLNGVNHDQHVYRLSPNLI